MPLPAISVRCPRCQSGQFVAGEAAHLPQRCALCGHVFTLSPPTVQPRANLAGPVPPQITSPRMAPPTIAPQVIPPHLQRQVIPVPLAGNDTRSEAAEEAPRPSRTKGLVMRLALVTILISAAAIVAMLPRLVNKLKEPKVASEPAEVAAADVVEIIDLRPADGGPVKWIDASRSAGLRAGIHVRVLRCEFADVMARDSGNLPVPAGPGEFLQIHLQITNRLKVKVPYISWYANHFRDGNRTIAAELADDTGRRYPPQRFTGVQDIAGHLPEATLDPGESVRDVLIFAIPPAKATGSETLFLQLPAAAVRRTGSYDFKLLPELWQR
ncbi:hypothetical protein ETAA8_02220 [Anatilimnocola aggregata]|uniref:DUF4352 domain-containing protein n=1 Tax=Anatilimnocola aggregata TaxID=2528021 RepID=A0A517Y4P6_9BACT|nr:hypothetical protein [Anatilimnocola aggregata]QDU25160.1 hypothetical protein ETAA8_02220 [Anatilimnocola aggregata]